MTTVRDFIKKNLWIVAIIIIIFAGSLYLGKQQTSDTTSSTEVTYEFSDARIGDIDIVVSGVGQVESSQQVELKAVAAGDAIDVTAVYVENNQKVTEGQLLFSLDSRDATRSVQNAQLALRSAQIKLKQTEDVYEKQTVDDKRVRQLDEINVQERMNALTQAQEKLGDYQIRAPFDGIITDLAISSGDSVTRTDVLASVITDENIVVVTLNEVDALGVTEGNPVTLTFDALEGVEVTGKVSRVDTIGVADQGVVGYGVEISIDESETKLRPGMSVNAEITAQSVDNVLIVPNSAVKGSGKEVYVERMINNQVIKTTVKTGTSNTFYTEITSGLSAGDTVITNTVQAQSKEDAETSSGLLGNLNLPGVGGGPGR
ncbi:MAG: efflux RND transporter periplasmic adaptor subunit [Candidatus Moranbacteria bacterium]|nr:efflux RND transporter periplasmic adaptor subunit [Candidatus Moranbacteria bacterium]